MGMTLYKERKNVVATWELCNAAAMRKEKKNSESK